ncbi:hypothetical protein BC829DRAFT_390840 [Chytridium lagenaria]|nr:hypothetical protein BC829DRAFT_390840 [Chytridium lagenaria]
MSHPLNTHSSRRNSTSSVHSSASSRIPSSIISRNADGTGPFMMAGILSYKKNLGSTRKRYVVLVKPFSGTIFRSSSTCVQVALMTKLSGNRRLNADDHLTPDIQDPKVCAIYGNIAKAAVEKTPLMIIRLLCKMELGTPCHFRMRVGADDLRFVATTSHEYQEWEDSIREAMAVASGEGIKYRAGSAARRDLAGERGISQSPAPSNSDLNNIAITFLPYLHRLILFPFLPTTLPRPPSTGFSSPQTTTSTSASPFPTSYASSIQSIQTPDALSSSALSSSAASVHTQNDEPTWDDEQAHVGVSVAPPLLSLAFEETKDETAGSRRGSAKYFPATPLAVGEDATKKSKRVSAAPATAVVMRDTTGWRDSGMGMSSASSISGGSVVADVGASSSRPLDPPRSSQTESSLSSRLYDHTYHDNQPTKPAPRQSIQSPKRMSNRSSTSASSNLSGPAVPEKTGYPLTALALGQATPQRRVVPEQHAVKTTASPPSAYQPYVYPTDATSYYQQPQQPQQQQPYPVQQQPQQQPTDPAAAAADPVAAYYYGYAAAAQHQQQALEAKQKAGSGSGSVASGGSGGGTSPTRVTPPGTPTQKK